MLKKVTLISALVLVVCLIAGVVLIPLAIRDFLQNGDQIIGKVLNSTEVYRFDAKDVTQLDLNFNDLAVYIEQSKDNNVYLRMEGLFADRYQISSQTWQEEEKNILSASIDDDALFFDTKIPYLLRSGLTDTSVAWVIVRVPSWVAVETSGSPWCIRCTEGVQFQNRSYYDDRLWNTEEKEWQQRHLYEQTALNRFNSIKGAFVSELRKNLVQLQTGEISLDSYNARLDEATQNHMERMQQQLFPGESEQFDIVTLNTLLENYFELYCGAMKQQGLMQGCEEFSEQYTLYQERYADLRDAADEALDEFTDYYEGYLYDLRENGEWEPEAPVETENPEKSEVPVEAENPEDTEPSASSSQIEIAAESVAPAESASSEQAESSSSIPDDILHASSVYSSGSES